jgi:hypothetical protein
MFTSRHITYLAFLRRQSPKSKLPSCRFKEGSMKSLLRPSVKAKAAPPPKELRDLGESPGPGGTCFFDRWRYQQSELRAGRAVRSSSGETCPLPQLLLPAIEHRQHNELLPPIQQEPRPPPVRSVPPFSVESLLEDSCCEGKMEFHAVVCWSAVFG